VILINGEKIMRFEETGLKENTLVRDAFNYAAAYYKSVALDMVRQNLEDSYMKQLTALDSGQATGRYSDEEYNERLARYDQSLEAQKKRLPQFAEQQFNALFNKKKIAPVLTIQQHSDESTPERLAAALLLDCARDSVEHKNLEERFGTAVAGPIAEILHADSYPGSRNDALAATSSDAKSIYAAEIIASLNQLPDDARMAEMQGQKLLLPARALFAQAQPLMGSDKGLDTQLVDAFNRAAEILASPYRIEIGTNKIPKLVKTKGAPKFTPKRGPKLPSGDGF
jgi:hypothetical protein